MTQKTIIFIDAGFLSKLSIHLGGGKYLKFDLIKLVEIFAKKEKLEIEHIFYYTAPPFISGRPNDAEKTRKENYDRFILKLSKIKNLTIKEGRCQRVKENGKFKFTQKGVDTHLTMDLIKTPFLYKNIKRIILIACDTDFVPAINDIYSQNIETILYTFYDLKRNSNFSKSNELLQNVKKHVLIRREDFEESALKEKKKMEYSKELSVLIPLLKEIGKEIIEIYNSDFSHELKDDNSPLTKADLLSEELLIQKLEKEFPDYGIISEESENSDDVYEKEKIWVMDPLDGTMDFVQKTGGFSIMVALLENRKPVLGIVYAPALDKMYFAEKGIGTYFKEGNLEPVKVNVSKIDDITEFRLVRSRNHFSKADEDFCESLQISSFIKMGSVGIKFGKIAQGEAEICYYTTDKMGVWDDAASHIILKEAGGDVFDLRGKEPQYDLQGRKMKHGFIGTNGKIKREEILKHLN